MKTFPILSIVALLFASVATWAQSPNDLYYNKAVTGSYQGENLGQANTSWHLGMIKAAEAWNLNSGNGNIVVAILDNAVWIDHPDLQNKIVSAIDLADGDNDPYPPAATYTWSHGTHVAGIVGGETNNTIGIASVGNGISLMAVKLATDAEGGTTLSNIALGIIWAADNGANIINIPSADTQWTQELLNAVNYAYNKGCVIVAAAGDLGVEAPCYPAALEHVIAVASCDADEGLSAFSNRGDRIDVVAPGGFATDGNQQGVGRFSVLSTTYNLAGTIDGITPGITSGAGSYTLDATGVSITGNYDLMHGTSVAGAVVSGICGLILSANPDLTATQVKNILKSSCDPSPDGYGRVNAEKAVQAAIDARQTLVADFKANKTFDNLNEPFNFNDLSVGDPDSWAWEFEKGVPATSTERHPQGIRFPERGIYRVKLTVTKGSNTSTETKEKLIIVGNQSDNPDDYFQSNWTEQYSGLNINNSVLKIEAIDDQTVWLLSAVTNTGEPTKQLSRTTDGGLRWNASTFDIKPAETVTDLSAVNATDAWLLVSENSGGAIYAVKNGGNVGIRQQTMTHTPKVIKMFDASNGVAIGAAPDGTLEIYTTANGQDWARIVNAPTLDSGEEVIARLCAAVEDHIWIGTNQGYIYKSEDKGSTWTKYAVVPGITLQSLSFSNKLQGVALCHGIAPGHIWLGSTTDGGATWKQISDQGNRLTDISAVPGSPALYVALIYDPATRANCQSLYTDDAGATWNTIDTEVPYTTLSMLNAKTGWAGSPVSTLSGGIYKWVERSEPAPTEYHTIHLEVAPGIELYGFRPGELLIEDGRHLHLQFLPEDRTATADDVLFLIDGVETEFKNLGENHYFSYILNPVEADHTILIALKEYPVNFPDIDGLTITGETKALYGKDYIFILTSETLDLDDISVYANGTELDLMGPPCGLYTYKVKKVTGPINITIEGIDPVGNAEIAEGMVSVATRNGQLIIDNGKSATQLTIYTLTGYVYTSRNLPVGTTTVDLPQGVYIVRAGTETFKVVN